MTLFLVCFVVPEVSTGPINGTQLVPPLLADGRTGTWIDGHWMLGCVVSFADKSAQPKIKKLTASFHLHVNFILTVTHIGILVEAPLIYLVTQLQTSNC